MMKCKRKIEDFSLAFHHIQCKTIFINFGEKCGTTHKWTDLFVNNHYFAPYHGHALSSSITLLIIGPGGTLSQRGHKRLRQSCLTGPSFPSVKSLHLPCTW